MKGGELQWIGKKGDGRENIKKQTTGNRKKYEVEPQEKRKVIREECEGEGEGKER